MNPSEIDRNQRATRMAASEAREYARGVLAEVDHADADPAAGLVRDDDLRELLVFARQAWDRHAPDDAVAFDDTNWRQDRVEPAASAFLTDAVEDGNLSQLEYLTGDLSYENDVSGLHTAAKIEDWLCRGEQTSLIYIAALMGAGKTDLALSLLEVVANYHRRLRDLVGRVEVEVEQDGVTAEAVTEDSLPTLKFAANFGVEVPDRADLPPVDCVQNYDDLVAWTEGHGSEDSLWYIFDEASSELTAQSGSNAQDVAEVMAPFVKKMRKSGVEMVVIGHDKKDVAPAIRMLADVVDKTGTKTASVYESIKNREPSGHLFDLDRIPPTTYEFDTDDTADWSWGTALDEDGDLADLDPLDTEQFRTYRNERIRKLYHDFDMTYENITEVMSVSEGTVSNALNGSA